MADTSKRIIYENSEGGVSIFVPAPEAPLSLTELGRKVVPLGTPFWIVETSSIPTDRTFRNAWELDSNTLGKPSGTGEGNIV